jgi:hypothetical protein
MTPPPYLFGDQPLSAFEKIDARPTRSERVTPLFLPEANSRDSSRTRVTTEVEGGETFG